MWGAYTKGSCIDSQSVHPLGSLGAGIWARATGARGEGRVNGAWGTGRKRHVAECSERWGHKRGTVRLLFYVFTYCRCLYLFIYIMKCSFTIYSKPFSTYCDLSFSLIHHPLSSQIRTIRLFAGAKVAIFIDILLWLGKNFIWV
jgi:hypothetical protein